MLHAICFIALKCLCHLGMPERFRSGVAVYCKTNEIVMSVTDRIDVQNSKNAALTCDAQCLLGNQDFSLPTSTRTLTAATSSVHISRHAQY